MPVLPDGTVAARKEAFFEFLKPIVRHHNARLRQEREWLESLDQDSPPSWWQERRFRQLAVRYGVDSNLSYAEQHQILRRRVDVIPEALVLVQAAKESGWGRSRFALDGNALFGEWCFDRGCGIVPGNRTAGRRHEVRAFPSVHDAVASYMDNLNSHDSYRDLRLAREKMRQRDQKLSSLRLADELSNYSERGEAYIREVKSMILQNGLESG